MCLLTTAKLNERYFFSEKKIRCEYKRKIPALEANNEEQRRHTSMIVSKLQISVKLTKKRVSEVHVQFKQKCLAVSKKPHTRVLVKKRVYWQPKVINMTQEALLEIS